MNPILKSYIPISNAISKLFGKQCEVVIHDLTNPKQSVVYVVNNHVTHREIGQSFDHLVTDVLLNNQLEDDNSMPYFFTTDEGKKIKSISSLIKDENNQLIGMICINYDVTLMNQMNDIINNFLSDFNEEVKEDNVSTIIDQLIKNIIGGADIKNLSRKKCVEMIKFMDDKGIFLVKGSIEKVAEIMGVSKVTVYSYLDEAKGKR